ncbi:hypothetical protein P3T73_06970 [Kiritimatiellota bacterium B12222]|nr:hypothetical protein P3T73_06970 [Kiritimatiellota bacterium B12222]
MKKGEIQILVVTIVAGALTFKYCNPSEAAVFKSLLGELPISAELIYKDVDQGILFAEGSAEFGFIISLMDLQNLVKVNELKEIPFEKWEKSYTFELAPRYLASAFPKIIIEPDLCFLKVTSSGFDVLLYENKSGVAWYEYHEL